MASKWQSSLDAFTFSLQQLPGIPATGTFFRFDFHQQKLGLFGYALAVFRIPFPDPVRHFVSNSQDMEFHVSGEHMYENHRTDRLKKLHGTLKQIALY